MTATVELPWVVAEKDPSLPKELGQRLLELARTANLGSQAEIAKELEVSLKTVERLSSGKSSLKFGREFRAMLIRKGVKEAKQISLDPDATTEPGVDLDAPFSVDEWTRLGALISEHTPNIMTRLLPEIREYARACEIIEQQLAKIGRVK